jgi:hypothetical protein
LCWISITSADTALDRRAAYDEAGRQTLRVTSQLSNGSLAAGFCDATNTIDGVSAAGSVQPLGQVRLSTGQMVTAQAVTPGFIDVVSPSVRANTAPVLVGATLSEALGLQTGSYVQVIDGGPPALRTRPAAALPLAAGPRTGTIDDSLLIVRGPIGDAQECWVEPDHSHRRSIIAAIAAMAPRSQPVAILPLNEALERDSSPERQLRELAAGPLAVLSGLLIALASGLWWYARRQELSLYRAFGLSIGSTTRLLIAEWILLVGAPAVAGAAWGAWATWSRRPEALALTIGFSNLAIALAISALSIGLCRAAQARANLSLVLRGA